MSNRQNDKTTSKESESRNIYDEIRAEIKEKQASMPTTDAEVLAALSGQPSKDSEVLAALSGQPQPITKGEKNNEIK
jgi:hypothetical protein